MIKLTLLEYVQDILNDMGSDQVDNIFDTFESEQVAGIVKSTYMSMMTTRNWPHQKKKITLTETSAATPTHMVLPDNVKEVVLVNYNQQRTGQTRDFFHEVKWMDNDQFLRRGNKLNNEGTNVDTVVDASGIPFFVRNDVPPQYFTSFDDVSIVFDAYEKTVSPFLTDDRLQVIAYVLPTWESTNDFVPDLPAEAVPALLEEAKSRAMFRLKQMVDSKAEQESQKQQRWLSRSAWRAHGGIKYPDYGRKKGRARSNPYFDKNN